ncbi:hypothetical protein LPTSP2_36270 [Leptospira ellinghausenii]|uniref:Uncharacterized protein n=1 Tax=Leptospira ellinghausenii TaxID=1917822 RepID=A0A2P2DI75_9LEPT|nr:hypothetical protein [Leptospira ellinghausenii]GBF44324.1 hypothetical protein LPTSP2_36270 [Leptospira ellinghausenii]
MDQEFTDLVVKNAKSIAVSHLWAFYRDKDDSQFSRNPSLDYHLHFISFDDDNENIGFLCLDTGDFLFSDRATFGNSTHRVLKTELIHTFIDNLTNYLSVQGKDKDLVEQIVLNKCPQVIWDKFNEIKNATFFKSITGLANYLDTRKVVTGKTHDIHSQPETYKNFEYEILEERGLQTVN